MNRNFAVRRLAAAIADQDGKTVTEGHLIEATDLLKRSGIFDAFDKYEAEIERHEDARAETIRQNRELRKKLNENS